MVRQPSRLAASWAGELHSSPVQGPATLRCERPKHPPGESAARLSTLLLSSVALVQYSVSYCRHSPESMAAAAAAAALMGCWEAP